LKRVGDPPVADLGKVFRVLAHMGRTAPAARSTTSSARAEDVQVEAADLITRFAGSMAVVYAHVVLFAGGCFSSSGVRGRH